MENEKELIEQTNSVPSMDEFKDQIDGSFKKFKEGDIVKGTVIGISDSEVIIDLESYAEGIIKSEELSNDPKFSIKSDIHNGDEISAIVIKEDNGEGNLLLSMKQAADILSWDKLKQYMEDKTIQTVKISQTVNGGVITYLEGIRAFLPASQLSIAYVEDLEGWVGKTVDAIIITVDKEKNKLVLSAKEVEKDKVAEDKNNKINKLQKGLVTTGVIEKTTSYGAFVNIGDGLSGLVHISQICGKHIKTPNEVVKEGQEVNVKIIDVKDGKISLSMKAVEAKEDIIENVADVPKEYHSSGSVSTSLASIFANIKL